MAVLNVALVAADREVWSGDASRVILTTVDGDIGILVDHAPVLAVLLPGLVQVLQHDGSTLLAAVTGGFVSVNENRVSILTEQAELRDDIDAAAATEELRRAEQEGGTDLLRQARARVTVASG